MRILAFIFPLFILLSVTQGCSFSESSKSSSKSSSSPFTSSSESSSEDNEEYQVAIRDYTSSYISSSEFDRAGFVRGITAIATANGVTDWEDDDNTLIGIGRGLKKSYLTTSAYESYKSSIANSNPSRMKLIQKGYEMEK